MVGEDQDQVSFKEEENEEVLENQDVDNLPNQEEDQSEEEEEESI